MTDSTNSPGTGQPGDLLTPLSNTGVSGKNLAYSIDWFQYSVPFSFGPENCLPEHEIFGLSGEKIYPLRFYNAAVGLLAGRIDWHTEKPKQKRLVSLSGADCGAVVTAGLDMLEVFAHALYEVDGNPTRLDFAVDVFAPVDVMDIKRAWDAGEITSPAKTCGDVGSSGEKGKDLGRTVYIGVRGSERVLRVYDKAKREGLPGPWIRIEIETHGEWAELYTRSMLIDGVIPVGKQIIREFIQCDVPWFVAALDGDEGAYLEVRKPKLTDRQRWYREQILPAIAQDLRTDTGWLEFAIQGLLDGLENDGHHGPMPTVKNSTKLQKGVKLLTSLPEYEGALCRLAVALNGKEAVYAGCLRMGYEWNTKAQEWVKT